MAVEKGKVLTAIEEKFKGKSLTKNFKENLAAKWCDKIDTDEDIDGYIDDREDVILEASSEADRRAAAAVAKAKKTTTKKVEPPVETEPEGDDDDEGEKIPKWAKGMLQELQSLRQEKKLETISERFRKDERLKGIPEFMFKGRIPQDEDKYDEAVEELLGDWKPFAEKEKLSGFDGKEAPPGGDGKSKAKVKEASDDEIEELINEYNI